MRRLFAMILAASLCLSLCVPAFAVENEAISSYTKDITMGELQEMLLTYLADSNQDINLGTESYYHYVIDQLIYERDQNLKEHPYYSYIRDYLARYKNQYEEMVALAKMESNSFYHVSEVPFYLSYSFLNKTISEIADENRSLFPELTTNVRTVNGYSPTAAVSYANTWAGTPSSPIYNSDYPYYSDNDCANFVSQCLYAGGFTMHGSLRDIGTYNTTSEWYCRYIPYEWHGNSYISGYSLTTSWCRAKSLATYLGSKALSSTQVASNLALTNIASAGDIAFVVTANTFEPYHAVILTSSTTFSGHTNHRTNAFTTLLFDKPGECVNLYDLT